MPLAEVADGSEVRRIQRHYHHKIVPFAASSCDPPRRIQPTRIAVQQKRHHHPRVKRRLPEPAHIAARDLLEIEALPHQLDDKPRDMAFWNEVLHNRRQKQRLIDIPRAKILAHSPRLNQTRSELNSDYSDRLLEVTHHLHHDRACRGILCAKTVKKQLAATVVGSHGHNAFVLLNYSPTICINP